MTEPEPALKLTVWLGGDERYQHRPLYQVVLEILRAEKISAATLVKGALSYGVTKRIHSLVNEVTMDNLPVVIEAADKREKIERAASLVAELLPDHGLITVQPTMILIKEQ